MAKIRTHYDNLRVARNAPDSVIKAAYKALSQTYHPDKFQGSNAEAERITKIINTSYSVLIDPVKRAEHDTQIKIKEASANQQQEKETFSETGNRTEQTYQKQETKQEYTPSPTEPERPHNIFKPTTKEQYIAIMVVVPIVIYLFIALLKYNFFIFIVVLILTLGGWILEYQESQKLDAAYDLELDTAYDNNLAKIISDEEIALFNKKSELDATYKPLKNYCELNKNNDIKMLQNTARYLQEIILRHKEAYELYLNLPKAHYPNYAFTRTSQIESLKIKISTYENQLILITSRIKELNTRSA